MPNEHPELFGEAEKATTALIEELERLKGLTSQVAEAHASLRKTAAQLHEVCDTLKELAVGQRDVVQNLSRLKPGEISSQLKNISARLGSAESDRQRIRKLVQVAVVTAVLALLVSASSFFLILSRG